MKTLLLNPPARQKTHESIIVPPLGLAYLASSAGKEGFDVAILDAFALGMGWDELASSVDKINPDILGVGGMSPVIDTTFRAVELLRRKVKYVLMGGPHLTAFGSKVFGQCPEIDIGVYGEGERTFVELLKALNAGQDFSKIDGVITREGKGSPRNIINDIDSIPFPSREGLPNDRYRYLFAWRDKVTTMFTSRGCPYQCVFCDKSVFGTGWRSRSPENIISEVEEVVHDYGTRNIIFYDDLFTLKKDRVLELCELLRERKLGIQWKCEGRADRIDREMLHAMKEAGCRIIAFGVESGNQKGLDYLKKSMDLSKVKEAFSMAGSEGIETIAYFILGIPNETYEEEENTIQFAIDIDPTYAQFSALSPYYGTWLYDEAVKNGWYREIDAQNPADKDLKRPVIVSDLWDEEKLTKIIKEAHMRFYFRFSYVLRKIGELRNIAHLLNAVRSAVSLLIWYLKHKRN